ncbi:MAG: long-chain acyl-CoA synthetase [Streptosporangiaceae bacterium]|jgi:long-chain acyl-CoA synthetase|nr:long-chain acyl-CoA synthetase [Streptosporangiaceae bacterium]
MREHSTPALVEIPASANLTDAIVERAQREPDTVVMRRKAADGPPVWRDVTAGGFGEEVAALAKGLVAAGIEAGDRVALLSRTRYEWTLADYAIWMAGAVTVPVYETSSAEQVEWILGDSGARALILETPAHEQAIAEVLSKLPAVERVWMIEGAATATTGKPLDALPAEGTAVSDAQLEQRRTARGAGDLATIIYTSGTTGRPKGCELTHGNLLSGVRGAVAALPAIFQAPGHSALLFLPLAHSFARIIQVGCLESATILGHTPDPAGLLDDLGSFQPSFILAVPRVFEKVYNGAELQASSSPIKSKIFHAAADTAIAWSKTLGSQGKPSSDRRDLRLRLAHGLFDRLVYSKLRAATGGRVSYAVSGGAALGERLGHFFRGAGITILEGYGLTETSAAAVVNRPDGNKIGTVGLPLPGGTVRIADDGEILLKGPNIFGGYLHNDAATAETFHDGWLLTGDMGELDDEGYLRVTGRKKELIVTAGGKNVAPAVLEDRLRAHPLISQCMVVGDGKPFIACLITLDEEALDAWKARRPRLANASTADLIGNAELIAEIQGAVDEANRAVSRAESIRKFRVLPVDFTEESGYLTPSLKVKRAVVAKDFASDIDALYSQPRPGSQPRHGA